VRECVSSGISESEQTGWGGWDEIASSVKLGRIVSEMLLKS